MKYMFRYSKFRLLLLNAVLIFLIILIIRENFKENKIKIEDGVSNEPNYRYKTYKKFATNHRLAILVPYRDREEELQEFVPYLNGFLSGQNIDFKIFVINQVDALRFNRAMLINIGWNISNIEGYDYLAMHDVDLLPQNPHINYEFPGYNDALHLTPPGIHPRYNYPTFIGGILLLSHNLYQKVNGMSNRYWGWGMEDDEFYLRLKEYNSQILKPKGITTGQLTFHHIHDKEIRPRDQKKTKQQWEISRQRDYETGLSTLKDSYEIVAVHPNSKIPGCQVIDVKLKCDTTKTPWCQPINE